VQEHRAKHLTDLWGYGVGWFYLFAFMTIGALFGGLLGWPFRRPGDTAVAGMVLAVIVWLVMVVKAHRQLSPYGGRHRSED